MKRNILFIVGALLSLTSLLYGEVLTVRPGDEADAGKLGYGWSYPERLRDGTSYRWIEKREGEVLLELDEPMDFHLGVELMPLVAHRRIQHAGIYVNNHFVEEWELETQGRFQWFEVSLPAKLFRAGRNVLIIRSGYKDSPDGDPRRLSLAVRQVV